MHRHLNPYMGGIFEYMPQLYALSLSKSSLSASDEPILSKYSTLAGLHIAKEPFQPAGALQPDLPGVMPNMSSSDPEALPG